MRALGTSKPGYETDDGYWAKTRKQFMQEDGFAYLNTGTLGPTPEVVVDWLEKYWRPIAVNPNENCLVFQRAARFCWTGFRTPRSVGTVIQSEIRAEVWHTRNLQ
jgi:hypothetical protein